MLSAGLSLGFLPLVYGLARSFAPIRTIALSLTALSPLHLIAAQESLPLVQGFAVAGPAGLSGWVTLGLAVGLPIALAEMIGAGWHSPRFRPWALLVWLGLSGGAIAYDGHYILNFSSWTKGPTNANYPLAELIRKDPHPIETTMATDADTLAILSLSHNLPAAQSWFILPKAGQLAVPLGVSGDVYLYRPSTERLDQAQSQGELEAIAPDLWRLKTVLTKFCTPLLR